MVKTVFGSILIGKSPGVLHVVARHGMSENDAIEVFFEGNSIWNDRRQRFENRLDQRVLYWAWLHGEPDGTVIVLSCLG